ncbi:uncharacterized protein LOC116345043 [Contarinia nasturtii]|uniref:uncharacterized protein LOC116345043 n=1 Tax=Contarinia nasturtii TaxID=265458 RepID=UPI0012D3D0B8|nr:uncharacterized protein LOC116345043 [Contarinia nasturtii]
MAPRDELEKLKKLLENHVASSDANSFRRNVAQFLDRYESQLEPDDHAELEQLLKNMRTPEKLIPTYHEFVLFIVVSIFMISIFAFFGYKLYKSLTDRQRRREEKLRAKSAKKKK